MARRRTRTRTVYRRARRSYRRRKGLFSGSMGNVLLGVAAGFGTRYIPQFLGKWTNPAVFYGLGYFIKKPALMNIGAYELGRSLAGNGGGSGSVSDFFEG